MSHVHGYGRTERLTIWRARHRAEYARCCADILTTPRDTHEGASLARRALLHAAAALRIGGELMTERARR